MGSQALATTSKQHSQRSEPSNRSDLIRLWIGKLSVNAGQALSPTALGVFESIWQEGFEDLDFGVLEAAFKKTLRECSYWPVKVSDVRSHVIKAKEIATDDAAERAWQRVLEIRRVHWSPDIPGPFDRAVANLTDRVRQAARAAGVFREFTATEFESGALHTWAKKRFVESFDAWEDLEQSKFLLPDGEVKKLLIEFSETKALPWTTPKEQPQVPAGERLRIADELAKSAREVLQSIKPKEPYTVEVSDGTREALRRQAETLKRTFPMRPEAFSKNPGLRKIYERFGLEIPESSQLQSVQEPQAVEAAR